MSDMATAEHQADTPARFPWVKLPKYLAETGDTADAVHSKRRKKQWVDGYHCRVAPDGNIWVHVERVREWVEGKPAQLPQSQPQS